MQQATKERLPHQLATAPERLQSAEDLSVNWVFPNGQEARYVRREDDYIIVYLSSHNGCNKACRFCHLTQTRQTDFVEATVADMIEQARTVLDHYLGEVSSGRQMPAQRVHFNWMARGEPLASATLTKHWRQLSFALKDLAKVAQIRNAVFNISSIFPEDMSQGDITDFLMNSFWSDFGAANDRLPVLFYSLYSLDDGFRKRWLPKAASPVKVLAALAEWQRLTDAEVVLHWALIEFANDSEEDMRRIRDLVALSGLKARFNLVRYNPFSDDQGREPNETVIHARFEQIKEVMLVPGSRIVPRVGTDVKASCGMFVQQ